MSYIDSVSLPELEMLNSLETVVSLQDFESAFLRRVYGTPAQRYVGRLINVGLTERSSVLDLGCGFGQWTCCLSQMNESVTSVDPAPQRVAAVKEIVEAAGLENVTTQLAQADALSIEDQSFDGVFCFGVAQYVQPDRLMNEIFRVLKPGGIVYVNGKDIGGYIFDWLEGRHAQHDFDPRQCTVDAFRNTLALSAGLPIPEDSVWPERIIPMELLASAAQEAGLRVLASGEEGSQIAPWVSEPVESPGFFAGNYQGLPNAYELILINAVN